MEENKNKMSESATNGGQRQSVQALHPNAQNPESWSISRHFGRRLVLPPEADDSVSVRRVSLGSTLEFTQREYFSKPQPKRNQRDGI